MYLSEGLLHCVKKQDMARMFVNEMETIFKMCIFLKVYYEGGSICNENPFISPSTNVLGFNAICQTKDQSVAVIMVHETSFYLSKFNMLQAF